MKKSNVFKTTRCPPAASIGTPRLNDAQNAFGMRTRMIAGAGLAAALVIGFGGWAAMAHLDGAVIANGSVKVDRNLKAIQHRDGGIVKAISIREGDTVRKGQVLIALEDVQTRAELFDCPFTGFRIERAACAATSGA